MKVLDISKSGRCRERVFYRSRYGWCCREHVIPRDRRTSAQSRMREVLGAVSKAWRTLLTEQQRQSCVAAASKVRSHPRLGQSGPLTGQMHFVGINSARARIGRELLREPPEPVVIEENPVAELSIARREGRLRFELRVSAPVKDDIMVLGAAPCKSGRRKCRKPVFLGLLPPPEDGVSDITELYVERFGEPEANQRVFIRLRQQRNGWEGAAKDLHQRVLESPDGEPHQPEPPRTPKNEIQAQETRPLGERPQRDPRRIHAPCPREWLASSALVPGRQRRCGRRFTSAGPNSNPGTRTVPPECRILTRAWLCRHTDPRRTHPPPVVFAV